MPAAVRVKIMQGFFGKAPVIIRHVSSANALAASIVQIPLSLSSLRVGPEVSNEHVQRGLLPGWFSTQRSNIKAAHGPGKLGIARPVVACLLLTLNTLALSL